MAYTDKDMRDGFIAAEKITKKYAKTFYFASRFLPPDKRYAVYAIYSLCRINDDTVDVNASNAKIKMLEEICDNINLVYNNEETNQKLLSAFQKTVKTYDIPETYFDTLIEGMYIDTNKNRYENFQELYDYCYKVAGLVGLIVIKIFGYHNKEAEKYAVDLGIAIELTNIIRDIKKDFSRNRIYIPNDEMNKFNVSQYDIAKGIMDSNFKKLMKFQISRARQYYDESEKGISMISDKRCRLAAYLMKELYAAMLDSIEKNKYDVFSRRAYVPMHKKILIALSVLIKGKYL